MALTNVLLVSQIAGYFVGLILSLCIMVPMSMHVHEFRGHCLLFSGGLWQENDGQLDVQWASMGYCNYVIAVGILMFIVCLVQIYRLSMLLYRDKDSSFLSAFLEAVGCAALCALAVGAAVTVTLGFMTWCRNITDRFPRYCVDSSLLSAFLEAVGCAALCALAVGAAVTVTLGFMTWCRNITDRFPSCDVAAGQDIDKKDKINTNNFYMEMGTAQFGAWGAFATCVGLAVFSTLKLCRYHQLENIRVSMYRERQRLVNESPAASTPPAARRAPPAAPQPALEER